MSISAAIDSGSAPVRTQLMASEFTAGAEFIATLRRLKPRIKIMICPSLIELSTAGRPRETRHKPFEIGAFLTAVQKLHLI